MAVIGVDYCGGNYLDNEDKLIEDPVVYKHVYLHMSNGDEHIFNTGDFVKDWYMAIYKFLQLQDREFGLGESSSVHDFIVDGAQYDSAWVVIDGNNGKLEFTENHDGIEMFVNRGDRPTWEELKKHCKS